MPQVNIHYSHQLQLPIPHLLTTIATKISTFDPNSGICKVRAYPVKSNIDNIYIDIGLKQNATRDDAYQQQLIQCVFDDIKSMLPPTIELSIHIFWLNPNYFNTIL